MTLNILCTNDDGYLSLGIGVLQRAATSLGNVVTVAPDREQSATSNSLTLHHPLRLRSSQDGVWVVDGTPTDCVIVAVNSLLSERPDLCVSGVNHGSNMGEDVLYSGTVAAAMEATVIGIPAVALSWCGDFPKELQTCEELVARVLGEILSRGPFPEDTLFNVNFPAIDPGEVQGIRITSLGRRRYADSITRGRDPSGKEYHWIGGGQVTWRGSEHSDFKAIDDGFISVTPLHLDLTNYGLLEDVQAWDLTL